jgi:hypothetical protein
MPRPRRHESNSQKQRAYREREKLALSSSMQNLPKPSGLSAVPSAARWRLMKKQALTILRQLDLEMQNYWDARTEDWQQSEKGDAFQEWIDKVQDAVQAVEEIA